MSLQEVIIQKIKTEGPISFHDFMGMALYYPKLGYYNTYKDKIGPDGDYYTSPNLTPLFGTLIGVQLEEMWKNLGENPFTVVELGAGTGLLCHDILDYLKTNEKLYHSLNYYIVEQSPAMREKERAHLYEKITWFNSLDELPEIIGCFLSNELFDNIPVHKVEMTDELMEVFVDYNAIGFKEVLMTGNKNLSNYLTDLNVVLPKNFRTEINLDAISYIKEIASRLKKGYVITIDYGYESNELYHEQRSNGTLLCYHKHKTNSDPYIHIGEQDITAHVNFSALSHWGLMNGLEICGLTSQANFLLSLGFMDYQKNQEMTDDNIVKAAKQGALLIHTLLVEMGTKYKVLIQQKGTACAPLKGLSS